MNNYREKFIPILSDFLTGRNDINEMSIAIDDRLFELRQVPDETDEERFLSIIELLICEVKDGFRPSGELEEYVRSLLTPKSFEVNWCGENCSLTSVILGASNRDNIPDLVVMPLQPVVDFHLEAAFA
jgi:hypothetical protein